MCRACFDEVSACPPRREEKPRVSEEQKQANRMKGLAAARAARASRAADKAVQKAETEARKRAINPAEYDAKRAKQLAAVAKMQAARKAKKELTSEQS